ncbi:type I Zorya anti-phage system protein ZorA1, partial [Escherichia coli]
NEMMGQTVGAIQTMQTGFGALLQDMRQVSDDSRQGSAQLIEQLLSEMKSGQQAMQAGMNDMLTSLQASVAKIGAEGEGAGERMARQLEKMFADSEAREKAQAEHMTAFIEAIQNSVQQG